MNLSYNETLVLLAVKELWAWAIFDGSGREIKGWTIKELTRAANVIAARPM
jgi:hypothetical protein